MVKYFGCDENACLAPVHHAQIVWKRYGQLQTPQLMENALRQSRVAIDFQKYRQSS